MKAFQLKAREMREIVYRLTGYRVDTYGEKQYKLIHMYAESPDDYLLFEVSEWRCVCVVGEGGARCIHQKLG